MTPFRFHVFVCDQQKPEGVACCAARGSGQVLEELRREVNARGLEDEVQVTACGSLGLCEHGPNLVVYPEGIWYSGVTPADVPEIVSSQFPGGHARRAPGAHRSRADLRAEILNNRAGQRSPTACAPATSGRSGTGRPTLPARPGRGPPASASRQRWPGSRSAPAAASRPAPPCSLTSAR